MLKPASILLMTAAAVITGSPFATVATAAASRAKPTAKAPATKSSKAVKPSKAAPAPLPMLPLTEGQLAVGDRVMHGEIACEMEQTVRIDPTPNHPGHFTLTHKKVRYAVVPQETVSGAVRLEDAEGEVVWIQIPAKSMLLNVRRGQRIADNCVHVQQRSFVADATSSLGIEAQPAPPPAVALTTPLQELPPVRAAYGTCWQRNAQTWWQAEPALFVEGTAEAGSTAVLAPESALGDVAWSQPDACQLTVLGVPLVAALLVALDVEPAVDCAGSADSPPIGSACVSPMVEGRTSAP